MATGSMEPWRERRGRMGERGVCLDDVLGRVALAPEGFEPLVRSVDVAVDALADDLHCELRVRLVTDLQWRREGRRKE